MIFLSVRSPNFIVSFITVDDGCHVVIGDVFCRVFRSPAGVPKIHQKTGRFSWQRGNSQLSSPRSYNFAYVSESPFFFLLRVHVHRDPSA